LLEVLAMNIKSLANRIIPKSLKNNNTATQLDPSVRATPITNKRSYIESVNKYLVTTSKLLTIPEIKRYQYQFKKPICFYSVIGTWLSLQKNDEYLSNDELRLLEDYLQTILENPVHSGFIPFCDLLAFTIDINEKQLQKLGKSFRQFSDKAFNQSKKCRLVREDMPDSPEFFTFYSKFSFGKDKHIYVFWGLSEKVRKMRPDHRLLKISFNPARLNREELITFFNWLKNCRIFNYQKLMRTANVTRVDIAADLIGVHLKNVIADKPKVSFINYYLNQVAQDRCFVGTLEFGKPERSKSLFYDKVFKLLKLGNPEIKLPVFHNTYVPITRIERRMKMRDFKQLKLFQLKNSPYFLNDTEIYSPSILRLFKTKQRNKIEKYSFAYWLHIKVKSDSERQQINELYTSKRLSVAHDQLSLLQSHTLESLSKLIIDR
jgi:hypothetical protein